MTWKVLPLEEAPKMMLGSLAGVVVTFLLGTWVTWTIQGFNERRRERREERAARALEEAEEEDDGEEAEGSQAADASSLAPSLTQPATRGHDTLAHYSAQPHPLRNFSSSTNSAPTPTTIADLAARGAQPPLGTPKVSLDITSVRSTSSGGRHIPITILGYDDPYAATPRHSHHHHHHHHNDDDDDGDGIELAPMSSNGTQNSAEPVGRAERVRSMVRQQLEEIHEDVDDEMETPEAGENSHRVSSSSAAAENSRAVNGAWWTTFGGKK